MLFSSADNSDPRTNGKAYTYGIVQQPNIAVNGTIPAYSIGLSQGYCYYSNQRCGIVTTDAYHPSYVSNLRLYENGTGIGPSNSILANIVSYGAGRFVHSAETLYFSASNNSNPQTNGKTYSFSGINQKQVAYVNTVQTNVAEYATFHSNNQKIVKNQYGIFLIYLSQVLNPTDATMAWRLMRSTDNGSTFTEVYNGTCLQKSPCLETDSSGRIFVVGPDTINNQCKFYRFDPANNFQTPTITTFTGMGSHGKFCTYYDSTRNVIYYMTYQLTGYKSFFIINTNGFVLHSYAIASNAYPAVATLQYPSLAMSEDGKLFAAWTTNEFFNYHYMDIHYAISDDGGYSWHKLNGTSLAVPFIADYTGPTDRVNTDTRVNRHNWLGGFAYKDNALHFMYRSIPYDPATGAILPGSVVHYVRANLTSKTIDVNINPIWQGTQISLTGNMETVMCGFFATKQGASELLYAVSHNGVKMLVLASADNGKTWFDWAESNKAFTDIIFSGGYRKVTDDGYIIGTFMDAPDSNNSVQFVRIKAF